MSTNETPTMTAAEVLAVLRRDADDGNKERRRFAEKEPPGVTSEMAFDYMRITAEESLGAYSAVAAVFAERDAYREVLREFQDGRRVHNPHTRQVARDIEQQALARAEAKS